MGVALLGPHWQGTCSRAQDCRGTCTSARFSLPAIVGLLLWESGAVGEVGEAEEAGEELASESAEEGEACSVAPAGEAGTWVWKAAKGRASRSEEEGVGCETGPVEVASLCIAELSGEDGEEGMSIRRPGVGPAGASTSV